MKRVFALIVALSAVFAFTGVAMAQNRVEVKVTSEPLAFQAACDKAGGFSLEFDTDTRITAGDKITIDVSYASPSDFAAICKAIDFEISVGGDAENNVANRWQAQDAGDNIPLTSTGPVYIIAEQSAADQAGGVAADEDFLTNANGIYFRVTAAEGTQTITVDVMGDVGAYVQVGDDPGDKLVVNFLDQQNNTGFAVDGIYVDNEDADAFYNNDATLGDNTLCVDVSQWTGSVVRASMDSQLDKYSFIPSDPQIAHIRVSAGFDFAVCEKVATGRILCGEKGVQEQDTCTSFDYEDADGYVANTHTTTNRVIIQSTEEFPLVDYQIRLDILVNGMTGDNGVYFSNEAVFADGFNLLADACEADHNALALVVDDRTNYVYRNGAGALLNEGDILAPHGPAVGSCDVEATARATSILTSEDDLDLVAGNDFLLINLPAFNYDIDEITADDVVSVQVTLIKAPCGQIFGPEVVEIGTMCAEVVDPAAAVNTLVYPYFTAMDNDNWWDGIVITNLSANAGNFTAMVYEQDGDVGAFTGTVDANGLYQNTLQNALLTGGAAIVTAGGDGVLGNSLCYVIVCTDFMADGFAFMGSLSSNAMMANESMGYIPRVDYFNDDDQLTFCTTLGVTPGVAP